MSGAIDYQSKFNPPSEYQHAYEQERGRWLRRRLLWYSGTSLAFGLLMSIPALLVTKPETAESPWTTLIFSNAAALTVFILALRTKPVARSVLRIAFVFYVLASLWTIGYSHFTFSGPESDFRRGLNIGLNEGSRNNAIVDLGDEPPLVGNIAEVAELATSTTQPATTHATGSGTQSESHPATKPTTRKSIIEGNTNSYGEPLTIDVGMTKFTTTGPDLQENIIYASIYAALLFSFAFNHLIICLFIPWTIRESIRPATIVAGTFALVTLIDLLVGRAAWWIVLPMALVMPFAFVPGTLICWWRFSRFNKHFKLKFESRRYRVLQQELNSAREVHDACLPTPRLEGPVRLNFVYEPMRQIGGDLLMIYPPDKALPPQFVILFDVTGHGVAAALSVNRILGEIERLLAENPNESVAHLARGLNRYVHLTLARHHLYVSALLFQIDEKAGQLHCVNAGHPTAYHLDAATRQTKPIESTSMLLGVLGHDDFEVDTMTIPFHSGDAIVGYTDGASEASDPDERMLGLAGVRAAIAEAAQRLPDPAHWPIAVSGTVIQHRSAPPQDDTIIFSLWRA